MVRRVVALVLAPLLLANQSLGLVHSHGPTARSEAAKEALQPHFHFHGHHHHHHEVDCSHDDDADDHEDGDQPSGPVLKRSASHDDDAVYLGASTMLGNGRHVLSDLASQTVLTIASPHIQGDGIAATVCAGYTSWHAPPFFDPGCPIFLRTLSLLI